MTWILTGSIPALGVCLMLIVSRMVPQFRLMQERIDGTNRSCASRSPERGLFEPSCASLTRHDASATGIAGQLVPVGNRIRRAGLRGARCRRATTRTMTPSQ